jgi:hypothetical protein
MDLQTILFTPYIQTIAIHSCILNIITNFHIEINNKNNKIVRIAQMVQLQSSEHKQTHFIVFHKYISKHLADRYYYVLPILLVNRQIHYPLPPLIFRTTATIRTTTTTGMGVSPSRCTNGIVSSGMVAITIYIYIYVVRRRTTTTLYQ